MKTEITLKQYYAGLAMMGMLANRNGCMTEEGTRSFTPDTIAKIATKYADSLIHKLTEEDYKEQQKDILYEPKSKQWKPNDGDYFWFININAYKFIIDSDEWFGQGSFCRKLEEIGNVFSTAKEAQAKLNEILEVFKK